MAYPVSALDAHREAKLQETLPRPQHPLQEGGLVIADFLRAALYENWAFRLPEFLLM